MLLLSAAAPAPARPLPPTLFQSQYSQSRPPHPPPPPPRARARARAWASSSRAWISNTLPSPPKLLPLRLLTKCQAAGDTSTSTSVYQGVYGPWILDSSDVREVILYRSGLVTAAASFVVAASTAFLPTDSFLTTHLIHPYLNLFYALGAGGLGLSLVLIHIYVTQIKRTLQALWALGVLGSLATYFTLAQPAGQNLIQYVIDHPTAVWLVGPLFAAFTGLVLKEGNIQNCVFVHTSIINAISNLFFNLHKKKFGVQFNNKACSWLALTGKRKLKMELRMFFKKD